MRISQTLPQRGATTVQYEETGKPMTKCKYLMGETVPIRVPTAIAAEIRDYVALRDLQEWERGCVFTLGPIHNHRPRVEKLLRKMK